MNIIAKLFVALSLAFFILTSLIATKRNKKGLSLTIWFLLMEIAVIFFSD